MRNFILYCAVDFFILIGLLSIAYIYSVIMPRPYADIITVETTVCASIIADIIIGNIIKMLR